ncbi:hypothetical protein FRB99_005226 [Tulasnella sp. 403]|nr:hypothetical protein FRB99_005226 [Tulasnella sp. 403]
MMRPKRREADVLPPPVVAGTSGTPNAADTAAPAPASTSKKTTFTEDGFPNVMRVHWSRFKKRLGNGSNLSESLLEITESNAGSEARRGGTANSETQVASPLGNNEKDHDEEEVNEIVVDNHFAIDPASKSVTQPSDHGGTPDKSGGSGTHGTHLTDGDSIHEHDGLWVCLSLINALRYRLWIVLDRFFFTTFYDQAAEAQYKRETYFQLKGLALAGSLVLVLNWVLICILIPRESMIRADKIFYWAIAPVLVIPVPMMIIYDWPKDRPWIYQCLMSFSVWSWGAYSLLLLQLCGYYKPSEAVITCTGKEFLTIFYYACAFPVIALFALGQNRLMGCIFGVLNAVLIGSVIRDKRTWIRNLLNFILYMTFILWIHFQRETAERRLYTMRDRLKVQYRATQKAQVRESKAADSKKRFSSYIFHEVRVPLNTALLAVQNMEAAGIFDRENIEFIALEGSLNMMSKVLNDVLDFNRMDSGRFESVSKPYPFHKVIKGMLVPLKMAADARGLQLLTELDSQIDIVARTALYIAKGETEECIAQKLKEDDEESGLVVGDEHRLRQVLTNLASNAAKFTPSGGKIHIRTKLLLPGFGAADEHLTSPPSTAVAPEPNGDEVKSVESPGSPPPTASSTALSADRLRLHNGEHKPPDQIIIRIEIEDTGVGIRRKDMVDNRLFSPYVQTDLGKYQGGKGTGLGLALSKHIVRLSGGRLGVRSKRNHGSMFWVELAMGVGTKVLEMSDFRGKDGMVAQTFSLSRATTEAFNAPEGEGVTPSTLRSSTDASPKDGAFPPQSPLSTTQPLSPSQNTNQSLPSPSQSPQSQAMSQLMEHSGQIELLPRMAHRLTDNSMSTTAQRSTEGARTPGAESTGDASVSQPPSPTTSRRLSRGALGMTPRPPKVQLPPPPSNSSFAAYGIPFATESGTDLILDAAVAMARAQAAVANARPVTPPSQQHASAVSSSDQPSGPPLFDPPLKILVVDDDGLTRKLMSRMLTRIGCSVETAGNGKTALDMVLTAKNPFTFAPTDPSDPGPAAPRKVQTPYLQEMDPKYDVIFLDNQMPVMSGVEMVKKLRELNRVDFVVGVTGNALKEDQQEYLDAGVDAVLTKPVKEASLKNCLYAADGRRRSTAQERAASDDDDVTTTPKPPP